MIYVLGIDQSTQGTKALLFDSEGNIVARADRKHAQIVDEHGWVSHDLEEIYKNTLLAIKDVVEKAGIKKEELRAIGISNQRETTAIWDRSGKPLAYANVWHCSRSSEIAKRYRPEENLIYDITGLPLSPYFPATKMVWFLENINPRGDYCLGTIDSWLLFKLTKGKAFKTDVSNASRTQLFSLDKLQWDPGLCHLFKIPENALAEICDSDSIFGKTDLEGYLSEKIPVCGILGDSHAALFGEGCHEAGMAKTTYGTGSSVMMNTGNIRIRSKNGLASSMAWSIKGKANYVLEGNINYTGAVISWLIDEVKLIASLDELDRYVSEAHHKDRTVLIPAFSGLGAPYWKSDARAVIYGIARTTGKAEIVKAAVESIAFQVADVIRAMREDGGRLTSGIKVDGGPTRNEYLMQFESDITGEEINVASHEELSAIGAAFLAGISAGIYQNDVFKNIQYKSYHPQMDSDEKNECWSRWNEALVSCYGVKKSR